MAYKPVDVEDDEYLADRPGRRASEVDRHVLSAKRWAYFSLAAAVFSVAMVLWAMVDP